MGCLGKAKKKPLIAREGQKPAEVKGSDLERVVLTRAFRIGDYQKASLRHDFLMMRSQAGKAKGVN